MNSGPDDPVAEFSTLVEALRWRALQHPEQCAYSYLLDGEIEGGHLSFAALDRQARAIAALLQSYGSSGERALLLYPPGLEFIAAFFGCLYAGVIAAPMPSPNLAQPQRTLPRLRAIASDARPALVLTTSSILSRIEGLLTETSAAQTMRWVATDSVAGSLAQDWRDPAVTGSGVALLQYTSGSTSAPRGVIVSHRNLIHNSAHISNAFEVTPDTVSVTWLPAFHDMGLTNGIIQPLLNGRQCYLMPPQSFLQRPLRWLQAISRYGASISGGPNFAYELCLRRISPAQRETLDLSSWRAAYNGAEPIRADTLDRFSAAFASCGFRPRSFYPCYGLAEATLMVTGGGLHDEVVRCTTDSAALEYHRVVPTTDPRGSVRTLVGSGRAIRDTRIVIVDAESMVPCPPDTVGEIWVSGPSVADGYWNRAEETARTFQAYLASGEGPFLRTGDLGFLQHGELFVTGRLKDLIIIDGRNVYPQDIEATVERCHPAMRQGCAAAFSLDLPEARLIVAAEVERHFQSQLRDSPSHPLPHGRIPLDIDELVCTIRRAVAEDHDVRTHSVVLLKAASLPRTPSGKLQRRMCQLNFLNGSFEALWDTHDNPESRQPRVVAPVQQ